MSDVVLEIDNPQFIIRLYEDLLKMEVKGSVKNEIEEALENTPIARETIGNILGLFVPLHVRLSDIDSVSMDKTGKVKIVLPRRRDMTIPLGAEEAKKLVDKLNELIPGAKQKELQRLMRKHNLQRIVAEEKVERSGGRTSPFLPFPAPEGMIEEEKEAEEKIEEEEEEKRD
jgi:hypothetical protein